MKYPLGFKGLHVATYIIIIIIIIKVLLLGIFSVHTPGYKNDFNCSFNQCTWVVTHPVRGIKGSDLLGFGSTAVKNRIKGKKHCHWLHIYVIVDVIAYVDKIFLNRNKTYKTIRSLAEFSCIVTYKEIYTWTRLWACVSNLGWYEHFSYIHIGTSLV